MAKIILKEQTTPDTPSSWDAVIFVDSADSKLKKVDDAWTEITVAGEDYVNNNSWYLFKKMYFQGEDLAKWDYVFLEKEYEKFVDDFYWTSRNTNYWDSESWSVSQDWLLSFPKQATVFADQYKSIPIESANIDSVVKHWITDINSYVNSNTMHVLWKDNNNYIHITRRYYNYSNVYKRNFFKVIDWVSTLINSVNFAGDWRSKIIYNWHCVSAYYYNSWWQKIWDLDIWNDFTHIILTNVQTDSWTCIWTFDDYSRWDIKNNYIWNINSNTRASVPVIWTGNTSNTIKMLLSKTGTPSVDLWIRIETDNNGSPSGVLADANATATVAATSLTTGLIDTTITLNWNITLTEWIKYHIVIYQWTYWSETIDASNYYNIWYNVKNTTTRWTKLYDWSSYWSVDTDKRIYASSDLFIKKLLSKTSASFIYKKNTLWVSKEESNIWNKPFIIFYWIDWTQTGLSWWDVLYLSDTAWKIQNTSWTNMSVIWTAISDTDVLLQNTLYI